MSIDEVLSEARKFGFLPSEIDIVKAEYHFHLNQYLAANISYTTSASEAHRRFETGKLYAEGRARQYVHRTVDRWQKPTPKCGQSDDKPVNDQ